MKNKVLATLLAVCLFAGLAVPAFAADFSSSVEGEAGKATIIDFYDAENNKVITELTIKNGADANINDYVRVFEDKNTLILDHSYLDYTLEGDTLAFGINGSTVTAIDAKGTAKVVVKSTLDDKVVGTLTVKAAPAATEKYATGFRFKDTNYVLPVGAPAEDYAVKVVSVPSGSKFTPAQKTAIDNLVIPAIADVTSHTTIDFGGTNGLVNANTTTSDAASATAKFFVTGLKQNEEVEIVTVINAATAGIVPTVATNAATGITTITITINDTAVGVTTFPMTLLQQALRSKSSSAVITASGPNTLSTPVNVAVNFFKTVGTAGALTDAVVDLDTSNIVASNGDNGDETTRVFTIKATGATPANASQLIAGAKTRLNVKTTSFVDGNTLTNRTVDATTYIENVTAVPAKKIGGPASITLEVGEIYNTSGKVQFGPSNANVGKAYSIYHDFANSSSDANDYAAVETNGKKIIGVKVGTNKVVASLANGETATMTINVVAKGTKPAISEGGNTTVLSAWAPKLGVGETANIVVKADGDVTYKSLNEAVATVDAAGKITAVKEGVAKISVQEEGKDIVYLTVTVGATTTKPEDKPTDVPQTAVAALVALF